MTSKSPVGDISVVTLIRTDTTLDHSQKAEKVCLENSRLQLPLCDVLGAQRRIEKHIENKREREGERERERERERRVEDCIGSAHHIESLGKRLERRRCVRLRARN